MIVTGNIRQVPGRLAPPRRLLAALAMALALILVLPGCAAPPTGTVGSSVEPAPARSDVAAQPATASAPTAVAMPPRAKPAPPMSDPLPPQRVADDAPRAAPKLDRSCKSDADCVVKDVGNCCGYFPRCVNVNAKVDPKAVQAQCARSGVASVCGFKPVEGCECVQGECKDKLMMFEGQ